MDHINQHFKVILTSLVADQNHEHLMQVIKNLFGLVIVHPELQ